MYSWKELKKGKWITFTHHLKCKKWPLVTNVQRLRDAALARWAARCPFFSSFTWCAGTCNPVMSCCRDLVRGGRQLWIPHIPTTLFASGHKETNLLWLNFTSLQITAYFSLNGRTPACQSSISKCLRQDTSAGLYFTCITLVWLSKNKTPLCDNSTDCFYSTSWFKVV